MKGEENSMDSPNEPTEEQIKKDLEQIQQEQIPQEEIIPDTFDEYTEYMDDIAEVEELG